MLDVKRRDFITLLGGAAAWPLAARGQQGERMRRIGVLAGYAENDPEMKARLVAFREGLERLGWSEGGRIVARPSPVAAQSCADASVSGGKMCWRGALSRQAPPVTIGSPAARHSGRPSCNRRTLKPRARSAATAS
jgi:hypothetical protein